MSRRRRQAKKKSNFIGMLLILASIIVVVSVGWVFIEKKSTAVEIDEITNCPVEGANSISAIYIDTTDSLSRDQSLFITRTLTKLISGSEKYDKFLIYFLTENAEDLVSKLEVCNPGDGRNASALTSNKRQIEKRWQAQFMNKLSLAFANLKTAPEASRSPIIEGLKYVSTDAFAGFDASSKRVLLVSDLLQHSNLVSHYKSDYGLEDEYFQKNIDNSLPYLENVAVEIFYVVRPENRMLQTNKHIRFWEKVISRSGGYINDLHMVK
mgnify:CR=1 FL=1|tara:strand:+ start:27046 stop:27846 length:801 start_codon:yes stop_codon:yes gene_type:complete